MYISRMKLNNWKNFREAEAKLRKRFFVIGPNASGKSNFLDALQFLRDLAAHGLSDAVGKRGGVSVIRCLAARGKNSDIGLEVEVSSHQGEAAWLYQVIFSQTSAKIPRVKRELVKNLITGELLLERPTQEDTQDEIRLTQTSLEQIIANSNFRELANFFKSIEYQHIVPQVIRDPQGFSAVPASNDPYGRDFLLSVWDENKKTRDAWLKRIANILRSAVPQLEGIEVEQDSRGTPHLIGRFTHWRPNAARHDESQFSDGTLRLFGLLWSFFSGRGPLLIEEPELSLHPEVVRVLPQLFHRLQQEIQKMRKENLDEQRQLIISTHSREILEDKGIAAEEVVHLVPDQEGSKLLGPEVRDRELIQAGLSAAEVFLPKTRPSKLDPGQLSLLFN
ncbi:MAG: AAA family ATPase [Acidobacteriota bacterium]